MLKTKSFFLTNIRITILTNTLFWIISISSFYGYTHYLENATASPLSRLDNARFEGIAKSLYDRTNPTPLMWDESIMPTTSPQILAKSAIIIDSKTGSILYEKNADEVIPPASMTKLAAMCVVFEEIESGRISLSDYVPLPPEAWAINAPPQSSLMFLGEGHIVTLQEVLLGLNISSGNDAAVAVANYVSGSMDAFIERMNEVAIEAGLEKTRFFDSSGYSAKNTTTAREFSKFARLYIEKYPEALELFHTVPQIAYPQEHNLPAYRVGLDFPIVQKNTNPTIGVIEGVTGLKTGFIDESGYNLSLSVERDSLYMISVTMGGIGSNSRQGQENRLQDSIEIVDYAFSNFMTAHYDTDVQVTLPVLEGRENLIFAREAWNTGVTVPTTATSLTREIFLDPFVNAPIKAGDTLGYVLYTAGENEIQRVPLLADRNIERAWGLQIAVDYMVGIALNN